MMKTNKELLSVSTLTLAVQGALLAMFAMPPLAFAADDEVTALTHPTNSIEIGVGNTSLDSAKFGEYNGLNKSGAYLIGGFNLRGGDSYNQEGGVNRWEVKGNDLGTSSRDFSGKVSEQGKWRLGFSYDELQHNITDTYQTPFQGSMGGNKFTLPDSYGVINATAIAASKPAAGTTAAVNNVGSEKQNIGTRALSDIQRNALKTLDVSSSRKNATFSAGYIYNPTWSFQFDYNRLNQSGAKLISASSSDARTAVGTNSAQIAAGAWTKEAMVTLMNPTNYTTDTFNLATHWTGDQGFVTASYVGSFFRNADDRLSWMNPIGTGSNSTGAVQTTLAGGYQQNMLSTLPANDFNQLNLNGGYTLTPTRKLTAGVSYGRNTQNENYLVDLMQVGGLPQTSLNGVVLTTNANLKLIDQSSKDLTLSAGLKYNKRDNETASNVYKFIDLGGVSRTAINTPYSNSKAVLELAGDYKLDKRQNLRVSYDHEDVKRWCENVVGASTVATGSAPSPAGANCVAVPSSAEDKLGLSYRLKATDDLNYTLGYTYSKRDAMVDHNYISPLGGSAGTNLTGIVNSGDYKGYMAFFDASKAQNLLKAGVAWQASDRVSLTVNGRYSLDRYTDSTLGVQDGHSASVNFDAAFSYSENLTFSAYVTGQERQRNMQSGASGAPAGLTNNVTNYANALSPTVIFTNSLKDSDQTIGFNAKQQGLMGGKLEIAGDVSLSVGKSMYHTDVSNFQVATIYAAQTCDAAILLACGDTPEIYTKTLQFKLTGNYQVDKKSRVALGYLFQKLTSNDYYYNVYQNGFSTSSMMPTNQVSPNYIVNAISATYVYSFQ